MSVVLEKYVVHDKGDFVVVVKKGDRKSKPVEVSKDRIQKLLEEAMQERRN